MKKIISMCALCLSISVLISSNSYAQGTFFETETDISAHLLCSKFKVKGICTVNFQAENLEITSCSTSSLKAKNDYKQECNSLSDTNQAQGWVISTVEDLKEECECKPDKNDVTSALYEVVESLQ